MIDAAVMGLLRELWLVLCVVFFLGVVWMLVRPGAREANARHAEIPFRDREDQNGRP